MWVVRSASYLLFLLLEPDVIGLRFLELDTCLWMKMVVALIVSVSGRSQQQQTKSYLTHAGPKLNWVHMTVCCIVFLKFALRARLLAFGKCTSTGFPIRGSPRNRVDLNSCFQTMLLWCMHMFRCRASDKKTTPPKRELELPINIYHTFIATGR